MKVQFYVFFSACVFAGCQSIAVVQSPEKGARICTEICSSCGGPSFTENNVCYCYVEKGVDSKKCLDHAYKKSTLYGMEWEPIHAPGRIVRKARPVRGSFLDPIVANVFDKTSPGNLNNEIMFKENFIRKNPAQRLFKRSIKKDLNAQDLDIFNFVDKNSERKKRVPRSPEPQNKKVKTLNDIPENFSGELVLDDSNNLIREKRNLAQFGALPKFGANQRNNMYEVILQYPTADDEEQIQLLFPNTNGLDVSHEFYYEDSDEVKDDDLNDDDDSTWNRMSSNYNPFQSLFTRQVYSADPSLRGSRSLYWLPDSQQNPYMYPYGYAYCSHM